MNQKLFRNCPYAESESPCYECTEYESCSRKKIRLARERRERERKRRARRRNIIILLIVAAVAFIGIRISSIASESERQMETETLALEIEKVQIIQAHNRNASMAEQPKLIPLETPPVVVPKISAYEAGEVYFYQLTEYDKVLMARVVCAESRGEIFEGKVAVAAVILNRFVSDDSFFENDSIESIIMQSGQFADISWVTAEVLAENPECMEAVEAACKGWDPTRKMFEEGAKFFYSPKYISEWAMARREGVPTLMIGNHAFHNEFADVD